MPLQRIELSESRSPESRRAIADAVHRALVQAIGVPEADRFQVVTPLSLVEAAREDWSFGNGIAQYVK